MQQNRQIEEILNSVKGENEDLGQFIDLIIGWDGAAILN